MSTFSGAAGRMRLLSQQSAQLCTHHFQRDRRAAMRLAYHSLLSPPQCVSGRLVASCALSTSARHCLPRTLSRSRTSHRHLEYASSTLIPSTSLPSSSAASLPCLPFRRPVSIHVTDTTADEFSAQFDHLADTVQHALDELDAGDEELDLSYASGVLSIRTRQHGTYILNQHNVTRQVWLSSPISGPSKYNWHRDRMAAGAGGKQRQGQWCNERDGSKDLMGLLQREFGTVVGKDVEFAEPF